jgi:putative hydrolase of the HAD superfamily
MIKAIIFDFGGVCVSESISEIYGGLAKSIGGITGPQLYAESRGDANKLSKGEITMHDFWVAVSKNLNKKIDPEKTAKTWLGLHIKYTKVKEDVMDIISSLKKRYKVALLSNVIKMYSEQHRKSNRYSMFDPVILSDEVGMRKPEKEIYELTLNKLGMKADECVFIDDKERNIIPAREMGFKTILFKDAEQMKKELEEFGVDC